ncbi:basic secretory protein-like protein [Pedobacter sp. MC2016-05]|uniref:basic secretory protein-like protein n=1 Tax=Pedobacter sp. MC2016-05 TaxID=2994474 RepID=UPI002245B2A8|nr:basic secretory protein-like protein [Pedobacter sp. MC2016-05]MCX2474696.1 basic secretory protein-like protein [Pedobacter sp. MC2016-05]
MKKSILILSFIVFLLKSKTFAQGDQRITRGEYTLDFLDNSTFITEELAQKLANTFFEVYPKMVKAFNPDATKTVILSIDTNYKKVAISGKGKILIGANWLSQHQEDTDLVTHELMHIVQDFKAMGPEWLLEGLADCGRFQYGLNNVAADWSLPSVDPRQHYRMGYRVTARFLLWVDKYQKPNTIAQLNTQLKNNTYTSESWKQITGKNVDELWALYLTNKDID